MTGDLNRDCLTTETTKIGSNSIEGYTGQIVYLCEIVNIDPYI